MREMLLTLLKMFNLNINKYNLQGLKYINLENPICDPLIRVSHQKEEPSGVLLLHDIFVFC